MNFRELRISTRLRRFLRCQELPNLLIQKFQVCGIRPCTRRVSPERWDWRERDSGHKPSFVFRIANREVEIGLRGHVEERNFDGPQRLLHIAVEAGRCTYIVLLPCAAL